MRTRRRLVGVFLACVCLALSAKAQPGPLVQRDSLFASYRAFSIALLALSAEPADHTRDSLIDAFWERLVFAHQVPYAQGDSVAFLYRGDASAVAWNGDFNRWGNDSTVASTGTRLPNTDIWIFEHTLPSDARIDYKVVINGTEWMLDPANPIQQWSGFGPNSALKMPDYEYPTETIPGDGGPQGTLSEAIRMTSDTLGYDLNYRVYRPAGYDTLSDLRTLYITDGQEYADDRLGSTRIVLDNIIAEGLVPPLLAIFIDPRDPDDTANNRRQSQYADAYDTFAAFVADELVPVIDREYKTSRRPEHRAILGTSLGGIFSAYLGATQADTFGCIGIHSPAFWYDAARSQDSVYQLFSESNPFPLKIFMSTGRIHDTQAGARRMRQVFEDKGYLLHYIEVNEGHSWGNWRALIDDPLRFCWGTGSSEIG